MKQRNISTIFGGKEITYLLVHHEIGQEDLILKAVCPLNALMEDPVKEWLKC